MAERNVYREPEDKVLLRTADVYQTEAQDDIDSYSERTLAIVADFKNSGRPEGSNAQSMVGKSKRGEVACRLFARIDPATGIIEAAGFKSRGCLAMTACASAACMMIEGKPIEEALQVGVEDIRECVDGVPTSKVHTLHFAACAIRALVGDFLIDQGASLAELEEAIGCDESSISCIMAEHCSYRQSLHEKQMDEIEAKRAIEIDNALADAFDRIRADTRKGELVTLTAMAALAPACLTSQEFVDEVLAQVNDAAQASAAASEASDVHEGKPSRFANRGVGIPKLFAKKDDAQATDPPASSHGGADADPSQASDRSDPYDDIDSQSDVLSTFDHLFDYSAPAANADDDFELVPPEGYELVQVDGVWGLVESDEPREVMPRTVDATGIKVMEGATERYLYDGCSMSDAFAKLAFLSAEDDPLATFAYCVRDESQTYPRPMAESSLGNHPLNMDEATVRAVFARAQELEEYADIKQTSASNGDVYYFSDAYLSPEHASSLAEWASVERLYNV